MGPRDATPGCRPVGRCIGLTSSRRRLVRPALMAATLTVAAVFLAPKASEAIGALRQLGGIRPSWIILALLGELVSLACFSGVTYLLIEPSKRPVLRRVIRVDAVSVALSHAVPVGSAAGTALGSELLADEGSGLPQAGFAKISQSFLSGLLLQLMLWGALALELIVASPSSTYVGLACLSALPAVGVVIFGWLLIRRPDVVGRMATALLGRLPHVKEATVARIVQGASDRARRLVLRPATLGWVILLSLGNWAFDEFSMWASLRAFGHTCGIVELTLAFSVAQVAASLPISPGGLGVVEGSLVPLLVGFGTAPSVAVLGVLLWRLFNYWMPLPVGGAAYLLILNERHHNGGAVRPVMVEKERGLGGAGIGRRTAA